MKTDLTYEQALKAPTSRSGKGWAHAGPVAMQAALAQALGAQHCLNPKAVYDWANRHDVTLWDERKRLQTPDLLLVAATETTTEADMDEFAAKLQEVLS